METFKITGNWSKIKEDLKKEYPDLTDTDLDYSAGGENELVGRIERRLGGEKKRKGVEQNKNIE
ncbi:MAG: general stress protein CsbD [Bacteroidales bacterium]|nr:general stress protein CsbD [Bacteroidales bacterium]